MKMCEGSGEGKAEPMERKAAAELHTHFHNRVLHLRRVWDINLNAYLVRDILYLVIVKQH